eukprot:Hpha_TRINITY_DN15227_c1_g9::TRINITY_DN15227_c1_g9_i2::g.65268::m.65268
MIYAGVQWLRMRADQHLNRWKAAGTAVFALAVLLAATATTAGKSVVQRLAPSVLIRRLKPEGDDEALARLVCLALQRVKGYGVWGRLSAASDVEVRNVSGYGGSQTYIVTALVDGVLPSRVVLHKRPTDCGDFVMRRMEVAQATLAAAGLAPQRLACGEDWWIESHMGPGKDNEEKKKETKQQSVSAERVVNEGRRGALLRRLHDVDPSWYRSFQIELCTADPRLRKTADASHMWLYTARGCFGAARKRGRGGEPENFFSKKSNASDAWSEELLNRYADMTPFQSRIPALNRVVTVHGDYHEGNVLLDGQGHDAEGKLMVAVTDLEFTTMGPAILDVGYGCPKEKEFANAFLRGYLKEAGYGNAEAIDAALPTLREDCERAKMLFWVRSFDMAGWDVQGRCAEEIEQHLDIVHRGALDIRSGARTFEEVKYAMQDAIAKEAIPKSEAHKREQGALEAAMKTAKQKQSEESRADGGVQMTKETCFVHAAKDASLVLARAPGCNRVWLEKVSDPPNKDAMWVLQSDGRVVHAATGLCLATPVKYPFTERDRPWDASLTSLELVQGGEDDAAQLWCHERHDGEGVIIRHVLDGRVVAPNFIEVAEGRGVNVNVPDINSTGRGAHRWIIRRCDGGDGDVCELPAAGKWQPADVRGGGGRTLADSGAIVTIVCKNSHKYCLGVKDGKVCCRERGAGCESVQWRVVGRDHLQHVGSGLFLTTDTKYVNVTENSHIWEDNGTDLELKENSGEDVWEQRWVLDHSMDPAEHQILRHYGDGRCVDVHGWQFKDGGNMGTEHSAHAECTGIQYEICRV